jgi:spermidine/putrescine transport system permease protein
MTDVPLARSPVAPRLRQRLAVLRWLSAPDQGPLEYGRRLWLKLVLAAIFVMLYAPIAILIAFSFNDSRRNIVWQGFTTKYYGIAWRNDSLVEAFVNSLAIAVMCTLIATVIGAMTALLLWRFRFPGKAPFEGFMALPIVIPEICMGVALLVFFSRVGRWMATFQSGPIAWWNELISVWPLTLSAITAAHVAFAFPFVAVVVRARMAGFNRELEEASRDLGANEWQTFWNVIFPFMKPGLIAGALLAFTLSLDDFVITFFTSGPDTVTFPVKVYSLVRRGVSPDVNAASTALIVITLVATVIAMRILRPDRREPDGGKAP